MRAEGAGYIFKGLHINISMTSAIGETLYVCPSSPMPKSTSIFGGLAIKRNNYLPEYTRPDSKICSNLKPSCEVDNLTVKRSASRREALGLLIASTFQLYGVSKASEISDTASTKLIISSNDIDIEETIELTELPQESSVETESLEGEKGKKEKKKSKLQFTEEDTSELLISAGLTILILIVTWFTIPDEPDDDPTGPREDGSQNGIDQENNENEISIEEVDISSDEAMVLTKSTGERTSKD